MAETRQSLWWKDGAKTAYPALKGKIKTDVAVIGGGITGLTTPLMLKKAGFKVALIEAGKICSGVTGNTKEKATHPFIFRAY